MKIYAKKGDILIINKPMEIGVGIKRESNAIIREVTIHKPNRDFEGMVIYTLELEIHTKKGTKTVLRNVLNGAFENETVVII